MEFLSERLGASGAAWLVGGGVMVVALLVGASLGYLLHRALTAAARKSETTWDDQLLLQLSVPMRIVAAVFAAWAAFPALPFVPRVTAAASIVLNVATTALVIWLGFRLIDAARNTLGNRSWANGSPAAQSLLALGARLVKLVVMIIAAITGLALLGVPVASLVAGLGIGGLAVALAAQKTIENLFGALSIGVDRPFREGDFVRIGDLVGTVEAIGLRSTRVRTAARTVVTIPNGQLADTRCESFTACDRYQFETTVGLVYGTRPEQLRAIMDQISAMLLAMPSIWSEKVRVRFVGFGESSLDVRIQAWFVTHDWEEFLRLREEALLAIMVIVGGAGSDFAFPTRTVHTVSPRLGS
jgi:MscS family membrane protein